MTNFDKYNNIPAFAKLITDASGWGEYTCDWCYFYKIFMENYPEQKKNNCEHRCLEGVIKWLESEADDD